MGTQNRSVLSRRQLKTEKARRRLREFVEQAWPVIEPKPFVPRIHVDAICLPQQAVTEGRIGDLIINVPPGHAKSLLTCVLASLGVDQPPGGSFLVQLPLRRPDQARFVKMSHTDRIRWYQARWGDGFPLRGDQNQKQRFENSRTGYRVVVPMGGGTGDTTRFDPGV